MSDMSDFMHIASFDEFPPAEKLAQRLADAGIDAHARNDAMEQFWKMYNLHPRAHCQVLVKTDRADEAFRLLADWDAKDGVLAGAVRCPECGSTRVEYPQFSRRTIVGAIPAVAAAAGIIERDFYCAACQFTWPPAADPTDSVPAGKDLIR